MVPSFKTYMSDKDALCITLELAGQDCCVTSERDADHWNQLKAVGNQSEQNEIWQWIQLQNTCHTKFPEKGLQDEPRVYSQQFLKNLSVDHMPRKYWEQVVGSELL